VVFQTNALPSPVGVSPDGRQLAIIAYEKDGYFLYVINRTGGVSKLVRAGGESVHLPRPRWSPDGREIWYSGMGAEQKGAILIGSDTSGLEVGPAPAGSRSFNPVHEYLLVEQGVHIGEFHNLEELARDRGYEFCYVASTNKIKGTVAGFAMRPIALR